METVVYRSEWEKDPSVVAFKVVLGELIDALDELFSTVREALEEQGVDENIACDAGIRVRQSAADEAFALIQEGEFDKLLKPIVVKWLVQKRDYEFRCESVELEREFRDRAEELAAKEGGAA